MRRAAGTPLTQSRKGVARRSENQTVEQAVLLATPAVLPAGSVGETADMAGLTARSTTDSSSRPATILTDSTAKTSGVLFASLRLCVRSVLGVLACALLLQGASAPDATVTQHMVLLEPLGDQLVVRESLIVHNGGESVFTDTKNGAVQIFVPDAGVSSLGVNIIPPNKTSVSLNTSKTARREVYKVDFPLPPGDTRFDFSYSVPFESPGSFTGRILHTGGAVNLIIPAGVSLTGEGLQLVGQEPQSQASIYSIQSPQYKVEIQGTGSMGGGGAPAGQADDSGSSLDQIFPRIYSNVYTILGLAFLILAIGFVQLYRMNATQPTTTPKSKSGQ